MHVGVVAEIRLVLHSSVVVQHKSSSINKHHRLGVACRQTSGFLVHAG